MLKEITVGFFTAEKFNEKSIDKLRDCDVALFVIKEWSVVNIKSELEGKSDFFVKMGEISRAIKGITAFSATTDTYGAIRRSALCFSGGKLKAIADSNSSFERELSASFGIKSLKRGETSFGVTVGDDIMDCDLLKALVITENDVIINLSPDIYEFDKEKLVSSLAYIFATPIISVSFSKKVIATDLGETLYSGKDDIYKCVLPIRKRFREKYAKVKR